MKKTIVLGLAALMLAACADNLAHIKSDSTAWESNKYQVGADKEEVQPAPQSAQ